MRSFGRREAAVLSMLSEAVRLTRRRFPRSCAPRTFSASLSGRPSVSWENRGRLQRDYSGEEAQDDGKAVPHRGKCLTAPRDHAATHVTFHLSRGSGHAGSSNMP
jgi:hypothetical protein